MAPTWWDPPDGTHPMAREQRVAGRDSRIRSRCWGGTSPTASASASRAAQRVGHAATAAAASVRGFVAHRDDEGGGGEGGGDGGGGGEGGGGDGGGEGGGGEGGGGEGGGGDGGGKTRGIARTRHQARTRQGTDTTRHGTARQSGKARQGEAQQGRTWHAAARSGAHPIKQSASLPCLVELDGILVDELAEDVLSTPPPQLLLLIDRRKYQVVHRHR